MTIGELASVIVPLSITAGMFLYILRERRRLRHRKFRKLK